MNNSGVERKISIREWWLDYSSLHASYKDAVLACMSALNVTKHSVHKVTSSLRIAGVKILDKNNPQITVSGIGLSEQELRSKHDALYKLEQAVKTLISGKFIPEPEFRSTISIDPSKFRSKADLPQFEQFKGKVHSVTYWGNPKDIKRLKDEGVLS